MKKIQKRDPAAAPSQIKLIRKSNELVEARYRFDIWETRVFAKMLSMIRPADKELQKYDIHLSEMIRDLNLHDKGDTYAALREASSKLLGRIIEIEKDTPEGIKWFKTPLLISAEGFKSQRDGNYITVQFHPDLKPFLLELRERYLQYDIRNLWGLSSVYSIRIYELLKQYEKIGRRHFDLDNLRLILGIRPDEYKLYGHFKDKVILKAKADLEAYTDIAFDLEEQKKGRKVSSVTFLIQSNAARRDAQAPPSPAEKKAQARQKAEALESPFFAETFATVKVWGISETKLRELLVEHGEEKVRRGLDCTLDNLKQGKITGSPGGFFCKAVEEGWESAAQVKRGLAAEQNRRRAAKKAEAEAALLEKNATLDALLETRAAAVREVVRGLTQADGELAERAVQQILQDGFSKSFLERNTHQPLETLSLDDWRRNEHLRAALIWQIEKTHPAAFVEVQHEFDARVKKLRGAIEEMKSRLGKDKLAD